MLIGRSLSLQLRNKLLSLISLGWRTGFRLSLRKLDDERQLQRQELNDGASVGVCVKDDAWPEAKAGEKTHRCDVKLGKRWKDGVRRFVASVCA